MHLADRDGPGRANSGDRMALTRRELLALTALGVVSGAPGAALAAAPAGELTWAMYVSLAPAWFDTADTSGSSSLSSSSTRCTTR
jgi:hypothetical protein